MTVRKRGKTWWYDFGNHKYRGRIPEARTKYEAEQAEIKLSATCLTGSMASNTERRRLQSLSEIPMRQTINSARARSSIGANNNKRSSEHDRFRVRPLLRAFAGKTLGEITPGAIEKFKSVRLHSVTKRKTKRSAASVRHEIDLLSRIFSLAVTWGLADSNPCGRVSKIKLQNQRYRYLLPDEEPWLLAQCTGKRKHLATMILFAIGTGARKSEQLTLKVRQCDFFRNLIIFDKTKSNRPRFVEMNSEVREILLPLCRGKRPDDHVWFNPKTGKQFDDIKKAFVGACEDAGIEGLVRHDLRATYGTRLGEAGFNAYDIAKLMGHANISTSQRYVRNLPVGAGEAVMLKNQRRHNTVTSEDSGALRVAVNS